MTQPSPQGAPLGHHRVVVTGDEARVADLERRVTALGAVAIRLPVNVIEEAPDGGRALGAAATELVEGAYDWVVVTSANAVDRLRRALGDRPVPQRVRWSAVGPATGRALTAAGLPCHLLPPASTAQSLAAALVGSAGLAVSTVPSVPTGRMLYPRAEHVRSDLAARLRAAGWSVDEVVAYRNESADPEPSEVRAAQDAEAVLLTSSSATERVVALLGPDRVPPIVVTLGPSTSASARNAGLEVTAEADPHTGEALVGALVAAIRSGSGRPTP